MDFQFNKKYYRWEEEIRVPRISSCNKHNIAVSRIQSSFKTQEVINKIKDFINDMPSFHDLPNMCEHCKAYLKFKCGTRTCGNINQNINCFSKRLSEKLKYFQCWLLNLKKYLISTFKCSCVCFLYNNAFMNKELRDLLLKLKSLLAAQEPTITTASSRSNSGIIFSTLRSVYEIIDSVLKTSTPDTTKVENQVSPDITNAIQEVKLPPSLFVNSKYGKENIFQGQNIKRMPYSKKNIQKSHLKNFNKHIGKKDVESIHSGKNNVSLKENGDEIIKLGVDVKLDTKSTTSSSSSGASKKTVPCSPAQIRQDLERLNRSTITKHPDFTSWSAFKSADLNEEKDLDDSSQSVDGSSIVDCGIIQKSPSKIIVGSKLVKRNRWEKTEKATQIKISENVIIDSGDDTSKIPNDKITTTLKNPDIKPLRFQLSDRQFVDRGWTQLPTVKIMEIYFTYQIVQTERTFDWFGNHKEDAEYFYDNGDIKAKIKQPYAKWYYKAGKVAMEYFKSNDSLTTNQRCVVFSSQDIKPNKTNRANVLALFDYLGNGVVYDSRGKERLKYNQYEGVLTDNTSSSTYRWKWRVCESVRETKTVCFDTTLEETDEQLRQIMHEDKRTDKKTYNSLAIDVLEKQVNKKSRPASFKWKFVKINEHFSLRIIDQQNITLMFNRDPNAMKINLGYKLNTSKLASKNMCEKGKLVTPYDYFFPCARDLGDVESSLDVYRNKRKSKGLVWYYF